MVSRKRSQLPKTIWAYAYHIVPPQIAGRLRTIETLLDHEHADAQGGGRTWVGRTVLEQQITHILVVSDSPEQNRAANRRLEAALKELKMEFSIDAPMIVADDAALLPLT